MTRRLFSRPPVDLNENSTLRDSGGRTARGAQAAAELAALGAALADCAHLALTKGRHGRGALLDSRWKQRVVERKVMTKAASRLTRGGAEEIGRESGAEEPAVVVQEKDAHTAAGDQGEFEEAEGEERRAEFWDRLPSGGPAVLRRAREVDLRAGEAGEAAAGEAGRSLVLGAAADERANCDLSPAPRWMQQMSGALACADQPLLYDSAPPIPSCGFDAALGPPAALLALVRSVSLPEPAAAPVAAGRGALSHSVAPPSELSPKVACLMRLSLAPRAPRFGGSSSRTARRAPDSADRMLSEVEAWASQRAAYADTVERAVLHKFEANFYELALALANGRTPRRAFLSPNVLLPSAASQSPDGRKVFLLRPTGGVRGPEPPLAFPEHVKRRDEVIEHVCWRQVVHEVQPQARAQARGLVPGGAAAGIGAGDVRGWKLVIESIELRDVLGPSGGIVHLQLTILDGPRGVATGACDAACEAAFGDVTKRARRQWRCATTKQEPGTEARVRWERLTPLELAVDALACGTLRVTAVETTLLTPTSHTFAHGSIPLCHLALHEDEVARNGGENADRVAGDSGWVQMEAIDTPESRAHDDKADEGLTGGSAQAFPCAVRVRARLCNARSGCALLARAAAAAARRELARADALLARGADALMARQNVALGMAALAQRDELHARAARGGSDPVSLRRLAELAVARGGMGRWGGTIDVDVHALANAPRDGGAQAAAVADALGAVADAAVTASSGAPQPVGFVAEAGAHASAVQTLVRRVRAAVGAPARDSWGALVAELSDALASSLTHSAPVVMVECHGHGAGCSSLLATVAENAAARLPSRARVLTRLVGVTVASEGLEPLLHGLLLELFAYADLDEAEDAGGRAAGNLRAERGRSRAQLAAAGPQWAERVRRRAEFAGGLPELCRRFRDVVARASAAAPIIIVLDGLDQLREVALSVEAAGVREAGGATVTAEEYVTGGVGERWGDEDHCGLLSFLPMEIIRDQQPLLPPHVRVLISCNTECRAPLAYLRAAAGRVVPLLGVPAHGGEPLQLLTRLNFALGSVLPAEALPALVPAPRVSHSAAPSHNGGVGKAAFVEPLALSLNFAIEVARRTVLRVMHCDMDDAVPEVHPPASSKEAAAQLLERLAAGPLGRAPVQAVAALLLASTAGLSEAELLDLVCAPRRAKVPAPAPARVFALPAAGRVSPLEALRVLRALAPLLRSRAADGEPALLSFAHCSVAAAVRSFVSATSAAAATSSIIAARTDDTALRAAHTLLAAYFAGRGATEGWCRTPRWSPGPPVVGGAEEKAAHTHRILMKDPLFPCQPWFWDAPADASGFVHEARVLNWRKMRELLPALVGAGLFGAAEALLTDLAYCKLKCDGNQMHDLLHQTQLFRVRAAAELHSSGGGCSGHMLGTVCEMRRFLGAHRMRVSRAPAFLFQAAANAREAALATAVRRALRARGSGFPPWLALARSTHHSADTASVCAWTLQAHAVPLTSVALSADSALLATACSAGRVCAWDLPAGVLRAELSHMQAESIACVAVSSAGDFVGIGDAAGCIKVWAVPRSAKPCLNQGGAVGALEAKFGAQAHQGRVQVLALLPVEGLVVSGGADGAVKVWRLATSAVLRVLAGHEGGVHAMQLLPASESSYARRAHAVRSEATAAGSGAHVLTCGEDKQLRYWNISNGRCAMTFAGHAVGVLSCAACTALDMVAGGARDGAVRTWRLSDGAQLALVQHDVPIVFVVLVARADALATITASGVLRVWDVHSHVRVASVDALGLQNAAPGERAATVPCTAPAGEGLVVVGCPDGDVHAFLVGFASFLAHTPCRRFGFAHPQEMRAGEVAMVPKALLNSGGNGAAEQEGGTWGEGVLPPQLLSEAHEHGQWRRGAGEDRDGGTRSSVRDIGVVALAAVGGALVSAGSGGEVAVWDESSGECLRRFGTRQRPLTALALEPTHGWLLACGFPSGDVLFHDVRDRVPNLLPLALLAAHAHAVSALAFSPMSDGAARRDSTLLVASAVGDIRVFSLVLLAGDRDSRSPNLAVFPPRAAAPSDPLLTEPDVRGARSGRAFLLRPLLKLAGHMGGVRSAAFSAQPAAFSPSAGHIASASWDGTMRIWSFGSSAEKVRVQVSGPMSSAQGCVAWAPNGLHVASGGDDGTVRLFDARTGGQMAALQAWCSLGLLQRLSADSLADGSAEWDLRTIDGHRRPVVAVAFTLDGCALVSVSADGTVKAWDPAEKVLLRTILRCPSAVLVADLVFGTEDGKVLTGSSDGVVRAVRVPEVNAKELAGVVAEGSRSSESSADTKSGVTRTHFSTAARIERVAHAGGAAPVVTVAAGSSAVQLRHPRTLAVLRSLAGHTAPVTDLAAGSEGTLVASASEDGHVRIWDASSGTARFAHPCFREGASAVALESLLSNFAVGSTLGGVQVLDLSTGKVVARLAWADGESRVVSLAFATEGRLLAYSHARGEFGVRDLRDPRGGVKLAGVGAADSGLGAKLRRWTGLHTDEPRVSAEIASMSCSPDGSMLALATGEVVEVWDARLPGGILYTDRGHYGTVHTLRMLDGGRRLATGGTDGAVRLLTLSAAPGCKPITVSNGAQHVPLSWKYLCHELSSVPENGMLIQWPTVELRAATLQVFPCDDAVVSIGGEASDALFAGDAGGRLYSLALQSGREPF